LRRGVSGTKKLVAGTDAVNLIAPSGVELGCGIEHSLNFVCMVAFIEAHKKHSYSFQVS
jgi:hypothetical protein